MLMGSARADTIIFTAQLLASNETTPVSNADANAFGNVTVTVDTVSSTYRFDWAVNGVGASAIILSHIHEGATGVPGPVRVDSGLAPNTNQIRVVNGSAAFSKSGISGPADVTTRLLANPAGFYFNVHSNLSPGGVVRGQLVRQTATSGIGAPTLSEWGAILMVLLIIAACLFFLAGRSGAAMAHAGAAPATPAQQMTAIDWKFLAKVTLVVEAVIALALIVVSARGVDVAGALTSGLVVAFVLHLLIGDALRR
jgi:CHRD domain-containing protein